MRSAAVFLVVCVQLFSVLNGLLGDRFDPEQHENFKLLPPKNECGFKDMIKRRQVGIVGGYETRLGEVPWIARIGFGDSDGGSWFKCGGSLISDYYVLTAAHCTLDSNGEDQFVAFVRLGEWKLNEDPDCDEFYCLPEYPDCKSRCAPNYQDIDVIEAIVHEAHDVESRENDIALLRLEFPAQKSFFVQPVCLPYGAAMRWNFAGETAFTAGWGLVKNPLTKGHKVPHILQGIYTIVQYPSVCAAFYTWIWAQFGKGHICMAAVRHHSICFGDSGGPLTWDGSFEPEVTTTTYLLGITSLTSDSCSEGSGGPGVFTRVTFHMKWILDNLRP